MDAKCVKPLFFIFFLNEGQSKFCKKKKQNKQKQKQTKKEKKKERIHRQKCCSEKMFSCY
jgi:hypothetical protein